MVAVTPARAYVLARAALRQMVVLIHLIGVFRSRSTHMRWNMWMCSQLSAMRAGHRVAGGGSRYSFLIESAIITAPPWRHSQEAG
ncbi:MAG: hypothetical protein CM15mP103_07980 [Gammaproteobacteria bacterium]|nr:MAG: hypothetical protein CM15mP103_07980 [Gammaproteobacteria bacterium]